jgi:glutathione gamma-glutamylcysteinyltransferase
MANMTQQTYHRRPLPGDLVDFSSDTGRAWLADALREGSAQSFFPLVAHLHTQAEPAWCGFGTLVTVLNALEIDPGRTWKGQWRFFGEELLICCKSLELAAAEGFSLGEVGCLAACNGAEVDIRRAEPGSEPEFRAQLVASTRALRGPFLVANYARTELGQSGSGHFSPLAAWHQASDHVLVLDVARFKYPPHWVPVQRLWRAMATRDDAAGGLRGWLAISRPNAASEPAWPVGIEELAERLTKLGAPVCALPPRRGASSGCGRDG